MYFPEFCFFPECFKLVHGDEEQYRLIFRWAWLLNFLRVMFFVVGTFILLITTCALCGFACMLSSVVRDDYYNRRRIQQREEEFHNLEERFREVANVGDLIIPGLITFRFIQIAGGRRTPVSAPLGQYGAFDQNGAFLIFASVFHYFSSINAKIEEKKHKLCFTSYENTVVLFPEAKITNIKKKPFLRPREHNLLKLNEKFAD